jgi:hypothetical protein
LEAEVSAENWHQERDRLVQLLHAIRSNPIADAGKDGVRQVLATDRQKVSILEERLATLNDRLGDRSS